VPNDLSDVQAKSAARLCGGFPLTCVVTYRDQRYQWRRALFPRALFKNYWVVVPPTSARMSKFAIGEQVENVADDHESGTIVAMFPTVDGSFRYVVNTDGYGGLQSFTEEKPAFKRALVSDSVRTTNRGIT
jgi:hypothetical protein